MCFLDLNHEVVLQFEILSNLSHLGILQLWVYSPIVHQSSPEQDKMWSFYNHDPDNFTCQRELSAILYVNHQLGYYICHF